MGERSIISSAIMEVTCKTVNTELRPVICKEQTVYSDLIVGFQNSIPCKEELEKASFGVFQYGISFNT